MGILADYRGDVTGFASRLSRRTAVVAALLVVACIAGGIGWKFYTKATSTEVTAYFENTNGLYAGDDVKLMGVTVGKIDTITADGDKMKVVFRVRGQDIPAGAEAVIMSPTLVSSRFIQLSPGYSGGPTLADGAVIPVERTKIPVEWDDFRDQLESLSTALGTDADGQRGPLGDFISSAATTLDGKGRDINRTLTELSKAAQTLGDGRSDMFATIRNLKVFASALSLSGDQMAQFNRDLASVSSVLTTTDDELATAVTSVDAVLNQVTTFVGNNRDKLATSVSKLASVTTALKQSQPDIEQLLHVGPNAFANFYNIYQPAQGTLTGALSVTQFQNPIQFICGAIQSASGEGAMESARRCAQYLGPVLNNIAFNYPPVGTNAVQSVQMRPEQIDYSQKNLKPDAGQKDTSVPGVFTGAGGNSGDSTRKMVRRGSGLAGLMRLPGTGGR